MSDRCRNCGYCSHCGRSDRVNPWYPRYPWGYPNQPYWYSSPNINISPVSKGYATGGPITNTTTAGTN